MSLRLPSPFRPRSPRGLCLSLNIFRQGSLPEDETESKKPRRSDRLSAPDKTPVSHKQQLPSPVTHLTTEESSELYKEPTATPPGNRSEQVTPRKADDSWPQSQSLSSPPQDTQPQTQYLDRHPAISDDVEDEIKEGVWGYLIPFDPKYGGDKPVVLKRRTACPLPSDTDGKSAKASTAKDAAACDKSKAKGAASGGYLIGRHPECGKLSSRIPKSASTILTLSQTSSSTKVSSQIGTALCLRRTAVTTLWQS